MGLPQYNMRYEHARIRKGTLTHRDVSINRLFLSTIFVGGGRSTALAFDILSYVIRCACAELLWRHTWMREGVISMNALERASNVGQLDAIPRRRK